MAQPLTPVESACHSPPFCTHNGDQSSAYQQLTQYWLHDHGEPGRWEDSMHATREVYLSAVQVQQQWACLSDKMLGNARQNMLDWLGSVAVLMPGSAPSLAPVRSALIASGCAYDSMARATRQVSNFASTNLSAATINAMKQGYREARKTR